MWIADLQQRCSEIFENGNAEASGLRQGPVCRRSKLAITFLNCAHSGRNLMTE